MTIEYFKLPGAKEDDSGLDNPFSTSFKPMRHRTNNEQARWWALVAEKRKVRQSAETSFEKVVDAVD